MKHITAIALFIAASSLQPAKLSRKIMQCKLPFRSASRSTASSFPLEITPWVPM